MRRATGDGWGGRLGGGATGGGVGLGRPARSRRPGLGGGVVRVRGAIGCDAARRGALSPAADTAACGTGHRAAPAGGGGCRGRVGPAGSRGGAPAPAAPKVLGG